MSVRRGLRACVAVDGAPARPRSGGQEWNLLLVFLTDPSPLVVVAEPARPACAQSPRALKTCKRVLAPVDLLFDSCYKLCKQKAGWLADLIRQTFLDKAAVKQERDEKGNLFPEVRGLRWLSHGAFG